tara:strand:- start:558 stop:722 length:165 start_codon:yes stop_codon:yes gene_type:complete
MIYMCTKETYGASVAMSTAGIFFSTASNICACVAEPPLLAMQSYEKINKPGHNK